MENLIDTALPFSDFVILYFVDKFGVAWLDFYNILLLIITAVAIGGWVIAFYAYTKCNQSIQEAVEQEQNK